MNTRTQLQTTVFLALLLSSSFSSTQAGEADVINVNVACQDNVCRFDVTLQHTDTGWKHYANQWEVLSPEGNVLATRVLHHPHVKEQPFTRSLDQVKIPTGTTTIIIRATDSVHGTGGKTMTIQLPQK